MKEIIDAKELGLSKSTMIEKIETGHFAILISRKSRIIMKDGVKLLSNGCSPHLKELTY